MDQQQPQQIKRGRGRPKGSKNKSNCLNNRCISISKFNVRCTKRRLKNSHYCGHHQPVKEEERCCAVSKTNNLRCTKRRLQGKKFCGHHLQNHHLFQNFEENKQQTENKKEETKVNETKEEKQKQKESLEDEIFEIEATYISVVVSNQLWNFYPEHEKWIKKYDNFDEIKEYYSITQQKI